MEYFENKNTECILCGEVKDNDHPFQCNDPIMRDSQEETITNLCSSLTKIQTSPTIIKTIKIYTQRWMSSSPHTPPTHLHPNIQHHQEILQATIQQEQIGWDHFIRRRLSKIWKIAQKTYQGKNIHQNGHFYASKPSLQQPKRYGKYATY